MSLLQMFPHSPFQQLYYVRINMTVNPSQHKKEPDRPQKEQSNGSRPPLWWRIWHSLNYFLGSCFLLIAALISSPPLTIFYSIGSFNLVIADSTELVYEIKRDSCILQRNTVGIGISLIGSLLYLIGSVLLVPSLGQVTHGQNLIIAGSICISLSQLNKIVSSWGIEQNISSLCMDGFSLFGAVMFIVGTVFLKISNQDDRPIWVYLLVSSYSLGGGGFLISAIFIIWRYFCKKIRVNQEVELV